MGLRFKNKRKYNVMFPGIDWLIENKVVLGKPEGDPSPDDLEQASATYRTLFDASSAPLIHVLVDESKLETLPVSMKVLADTLDFLKHPRMGWFILFGNDDPMKNFVSSTVTGVNQVRHRRFATIEESLEFLAMVDSTLPSAKEMLEQFRSDE